MPPRKQRKLSHPSNPHQTDTDDTDANDNINAAAIRRAAHLLPYPPTNTHRLLESGPVILISTLPPSSSSSSSSSSPSHPRANLMTCGFHMALQHDPPLIALSLGEWDHSFSALKQTGECVVSVPGVDLAQQVVDIGNCSGAQVDKWSKFGLTPLPAEVVSPPLVGEALANIECRVKDRTLVRKYSLWVLEPVRAWINDQREEKRTFHHLGDGRFVVDGERLDMRERMTMWKYLQD